MLTSHHAWRTLAREALTLLPCLAMAGFGGLVSVTSAAGQDNPPLSRAALLSAVRDAKASETAPPQRSSLERQLYWYDNQYVLAKISAGWKGLHMAGGDFPAGAGIKFGVGFDRAIGTSDPDLTIPNRVDVTARAAYSTRGYTRLSSGLTFRNPGGAPLHIGIGAQFYEFPQEDFFGLGMNSLDANRTSYLLRSVEAGPTVGWRVARFVELGAGASYLAPRIGRGTDRRFPSTEEVFAPDTVAGFGVQPDFVRGDLSAAFDWRDNPLHPHQGGRYGVQVSRFLDQDLDAFDFRRIDIGLQQYVPLLNRYRILALRAEAVLTDAGAGQQVPFYLQPTLGGSQTMRGFREFRFRDRNSLLFTAEYRWEAWWALDGALFVDAGTVAARRQDLSVREMDVSYGIGFRIHSNRAVTARLDLALSREGFIPLLRFEHVF